MSNARTDWIDSAKGVGILLVVYGHVARGIHKAGIPLDPTLYAMADAIVYLFHMPLFFLLSGYVFVRAATRRPLSQFIANRIDVLVYPYVIWSLIQGLLEVGMGGYTNRGTGLHDVLELIWNPRAQFWFLYVLLLINIVTACWLKYAGKSKSAIGLLTAGGVMAILLREIVPDIWVLKSLASFSGYFFLGMWLAENSISPTRLDGPQAALLVTLSAVLAWLGIDRSLPMHTVLAFAGAMSCSAAICVLCVHAGKVAQLNRWLVWLGQRSMPIFLVHIIFASGIRIVLQRIGGIHDGAIHVVTGVVFGVVLSLIAYEVLVRMGAAFFFRIPPRWSVEARTARPSAI